ncbi:MAG: hypothetical protein M1825_005792 [Sarcosagium campestre]|nr:MAG: hypothetical protein M1825_005792 [Sarcosagium campestre]
MPLRFTYTLVFLALLELCVAIVHIDPTSCIEEEDRTRIRDAIDECILSAELSFLLLQSPSPKQNTVDAFEALFGNPSRDAPGWEHVKELFRRLIYTKESAEIVTIYCNEDHLVLAEKRSTGQPAWFDNEAQVMFNADPENGHDPLGRPYTPCQANLHPLGSKTNPLPHRTDHLGPLPSNPIDDTESDVEMSEYEAVLDPIKVEKSYDSWDALPAAFRGRGTLAYMYAERHIVLCDIGLRRGLYTTSLTEALKTDGSTHSFAHQSINDFRPLSTTLLHELSHTKIVGDMETEDFAVIEKGKPRTCYGWTQCMKLAQTHPEKALRNAESFAMFAKAMFLDEYDWSDGYADGKRKKKKSPLAGLSDGRDSRLRPQKQISKKKQKHGSPRRPGHDSQRPSPDDADAIEKIRDQIFSGQPFTAVEDRLLDLLLV